MTLINDLAVVLFPPSFKSSVTPRDNFNLAIYLLNPV